MANKVIPDLEELSGADFAPGHLVIVDTGAATFKVTLAQLASFLGNHRSPIEVEFDGEETGEKEVDVAAHVTDARRLCWLLKKPGGEQMPAVTIRTPDAETVVIDTGDFALEAGTYTLLGV